CPRRTVRDTVLIEAAVAAGSKLREGFAARELLREGDRVIGIRGQAKGGAVVDDRARVVVGADGRRSLVASLVGAPEYHCRPALTCTYYGYWSGVRLAAGTEFETYWRPGTMLLAFPTNDGLTCVVVGVAVGAFAAFRDDVAGSFFRSL